MQASGTAGPAGLSGLLGCEAATGAAARGQRGSGNVKAIVWLLILAAFVYGCVKVVPVLYAEYQFQDFMQTTARFATINRQVPEEISKNVAQEAQSRDIPLTAKDIHVTAEAGNVKIDADYTVIVDLQVYQLTLNLHPSASNNAL